MMNSQLVHTGSDNSQLEQSHGAWSGLTAGGAGNAKSARQAPHFMPAILLVYTYVRDNIALTLHTTFFLYNPHCMGVQAQAPSGDLTGFAPQATVEAGDLGLFSDRRWAESQTRHVELWNCGTKPNMTCSM